MAKAIQKPDKQHSIDSGREHEQGQFMNNCRIDLPPGDVVEKIQFEQIIAMNGTLAELFAINPELKRLGTEAQAGVMAFLASYGNSPVGLYLPFQQSWELKGYTRGRLIKSFSLVPGEEQTVELFTWDRQKSQLESTSEAESEQTVENTGTRRDALDVTQDVARQTGFHMSTGGKVGFNINKMVDVDMNQNIDVENKISEQAANAQHCIVEATVKSAGKVRTSRTVKVTESREYGSEERVTRKLRNPNTFHTLNIPFFEILANYRVTTAFRKEDVRLVALIKDTSLSSQDFDSRTIRLHERALRLALLDSGLAAGFDAARFLDACSRACDVMHDTCTCFDNTVYYPRTWRQLSGCAKEIATAKQNSLKWREYSLDNLGAAAALIAKGTVRTVVDGLTPHLPDPIWETKGRGDFINLVAGAIEGDINHSMVKGLFTSIADAKFYIKTYLFRKALLSKLPDLDSVLKTLSDPKAAITEAQATALDMALGDVAKGSLNGLQFDQGIADSVQGEINKFFLDHSPKFLAVGLLGFFTQMAVCDSLASYVRTNVDGFSQYDVAGFVPLFKVFNTYHDKWDKEQTAEEEARKTAALQAHADKQEHISRILSAYGLRDITEAMERLDALLGHMNEESNRDHYRFAIASERKSLFTDDDVLIMQGILEATPIASTGDRFAYPVRLPSGSPSAESLAKIMETLETNIKPVTAEPILPTAALYSEAVIGVCNAAETEVIERYRIETGRKELDNELQKLEIARLQARLDADPPILDKDVAVSARVDVGIGEDSKVE